MNDVKNLELRQRNIIAKIEEIKVDNKDLTNKIEQARQTCTSSKSRQTELQYTLKGLANLLPTIEKQIVEIKLNDIIVKLLKSIQQYKKCTKVTLTAQISLKTYIYGEVA